MVLTQKVIFYDKTQYFKLVALCCFCFFFNASHAQGIIPQPQKVTLTQGYMELDAPLAWHPKTARRKQKAIRLYFNRVAKAYKFNWKSKAFYALITLLLHRKSYPFKKSKATS